MPSRPELMDSAADTEAVLSALLKRDLFQSIRGERELAELVRKAVETSPAPYALLLCRLLGCDPRLDEAEARAYWDLVVQRRAELARALGRPVHLRVAALDLVATLGRTPGDMGAPILVGPRVLRRAHALVTAANAAAVTAQRGPKA